MSVFSFRKFLINLIPNKNIRHNLRILYTKNTQANVAKFLYKKYLNKFFNGELENFELSAKKDLGTDKVIWQYWGQGVDKNLPPVVKACFDSVDKYKGEYKVIRLSNKTISEYIDLPDFVYEKLSNNKSFTMTFFSDLLRVCLLEVYGGIWMDATVLMTDFVPPEILNKSFFVYQRAEKPENYTEYVNANCGYFSWDKDFKVNMLSSFLIAQKNYPLITACKNLLLNYWKNENKLPYYYVFQIFFNELVNSEKYKNYNCEIISDIYPHLMSFNVHKTYTEDLWKDITSKSSVHKLTYYKKIKENSVIEKVLQN